MTLVTIAFGEYVKGMKLRTLFFFSDVLTVLGCRYTSHAQTFEEPIRNPPAKYRAG